jgi:methionyl-tRNA formyltransferase
MKFVFFGGEPLAVPVLEKLKKADLIPSLIVCNPDRPAGRKQILTPPPTKVWAIAQGIEVFQPASYKDELAKQKLVSIDPDLFVVVAYNFILPDWLLKIPKKGCLNLHPSLLPKLRGASPIRTAIIDNLPEDVGVTVILLDEKMDHGPILEQEQLELDRWPINGKELDVVLAKKGGKLLAEVIPAWINDELLPQEQEHELASYCSKLDKARSELEINPHKLPAGKKAEQCWHTICAFSGIGETFFIHDGKRIKITEANLTNGKTLQLLKVIPEGRKEISFADYLKTYDSTK